MPTDTLVRVNSISLAQQIRMHGMVMLHQLLASETDTSLAGDAQPHHCTTLDTRLFGLHPEAARSSDDAVAHNNSLYGEQPLSSIDLLVCRTCAESLPDERLGYYLFLRLHV